MKISLALITSTNTLYNKEILTGHSKFYNYGNISSLNLYFNILSAQEI